MRKRCRILSGKLECRWALCKIWSGCRRNIKVQTWYEH